jgi:hypothetical protein
MSGRTRVYTVFIFQTKCINILSTLYHILNPWAIILCSPELSDFTAIAFSNNFTLCPGKDYK